MPLQKQCPCYSECTINTQSAAMSCAQSHSLFIIQSTMFTLLSVWFLIVRFMHYVAQCPQKVWQWNEKQLDATMLSTLYMMQMIMIHEVKFKWSDFFLHCIEVEAEISESNFSKLGAIKSILSSWLIGIRGKRFRFEWDGVPWWPGDLWPRAGTTVSAVWVQLGTFGPYHFHLSLPSFTATSLVWIL